MCLEHQHVKIQNLTGLPVICMNEPAAVTSLGVIVAEALDGRSGNEVRRGGMVREESLRTGANVKNSDVGGGGG